MEKKSPVVIKINDRVFLRQYNLADAPTIFALMAANRRHVVRYDTDWVAKYPDLKSLEDRIANHQKGQRVHFGIWVEGVLVGNVNFINKAGAAEIGCWLAETQQDKGSAYLACQALISKLFGSGKISKIVAKTHPDNEKAVKLLGYLDFSQEEKRADDRLAFTLKKWLPFYLGGLFGYGLMCNRKKFREFVAEKSLPSDFLKKLKQAQAARAHIHNVPDFGQGAFYTDLPTLGKWAKDSGIELE